MLSSGETSIKDNLHIVTSDPGTTDYRDPPRRSCALGAVVVRIHGTDLPEQVEAQEFRKPSLVHFSKRKPDTR